VKGVEKLTSVRLAEILSERNAVPSEAIADALYSQECFGERFVQILVSGGHVTEWDLAKIVAESFNLPFLMAGNYQLGEEAKTRLPKETLFEHMLVPLDVFGDIVCVSMPVMITFDDLRKIQRENDCELFPYVGLVSENRRILGEMHKDYPRWLEQAQQAREAAKKKERPAAPAAEKPATGDSGWMSIFDAGDQAIQKTIGKKKGENG
jgi:hypothetical protein